MKDQVQAKQIELDADLKHLSEAEQQIHADRELAYGVG